MVAIATSMEPGCLRTQGGSLQGCPFTPQARYPPHRHLPPLGPELPTHSLRSGGRSSSQHNGEEHPRGPPPPRTALSWEGRPHGNRAQRNASAPAAGGPRKAPHRTALQGAARRGLQPLQDPGSAPGPPHPGVATATGPGDGAGPPPRSGLFRERLQGGAGRGGAGPGGAGSRRTTPSHRGPSPPPPLRSQQRPLAASERCAERPLPRPTAPRDPPAAHSPTRQRTAPLTPRSPTRAADASTGSTAPRPHLPSGLPGKSGGRRGFPQTAPSPWAPVPPPSSSSSRLGPHARPTLTLPGPTVTLQAVRRASGAGGAAQTAPTRCGAAARPGAAPAAPAGPSTPGPARVGGCRAGPRQLLAAPGCTVLCEGTRSPPRWDSAEAPGGLQPHGSPASPHTLTSARPAPGPQPPAHQLPVQRPLLRSLSGSVRPGAAG